MNSYNSWYRYYVKFNEMNEKFVVREIVLSMYKIYKYSVYKIIIFHQKSVILTYWIIATYMSVFTEKMTIGNSKCVCIQYDILNFTLKIYLY